jgi:serine/threonine-protein kinase HipA
MIFNYLAMNCDDHSKNFSFMMDATGKWQLSPAYDMTFAYNFANIWLREHLMSVNGKFSSVTDKDFMDFANSHDIQYAKKALKDVKAALANWPDYAAQAGLTKETTAAIASALAIA